MEFVLIFLVTAAVSFLGSVQLGAVNTAVIQATLSQGRRAGFWVALGGSIPELLYSFLPYLAKGVITTLDQYAAVRYLAALFFLALGVFTWHGATPNNRISKPQTLFHPFFKGLLLALFNVQLPLFWSLVWLQMNRFILLEDLVNNIFFVLGSFSGAFLILVLINQLTHRYRAHILTRLSLPLLNKIIGACYIVVGLSEFIRVFYY
jgi:threonine/homoserine/homoserine lactone efflux protein